MRYRNRLHKHYPILSLEELIFDDSRLREEAIGDLQGLSRPTEKEACIKILSVSLRVGLSAEENQVLILKLAPHTGYLRSSAAWDTI